MRRIECTTAADVDPQNMQKMLDEGWELVEVYHHNGLVTTIYEKKGR